MERVLLKLEDMVYDVLDDVAKKKDISPTELENAEKAVCLLIKIRELKDDALSESEMEYSNRGMRRHSYDYRDGMHVYPAMSRMNDIGYSRHSIKDRAIDKLERMIDETKSESEKDAVKKMIVSLEHMELY